MRKVQIVLASPGDVATERRKVREVILNTVNVWAKFSNIEFEPIDWENNTFPSIGTYSQDVINNQFGSEHEILSAIFWYKVGTPTPNFASGTVEEVERAISRNKSDGSVNLQLYFKTQKVPETELRYSKQPELYTLRDDWSKKGVYYWEFAEESELVELIVRHLALWVQKSYFIRDNTDKGSKNYLESQSKETLSAVEYMQMFIVESQAHTKKLQEINSIIVDNTDSLFKENAELRELLELPKSKNSIEKIAKHLRVAEYRRGIYAKELKPKIVEMKAIFVKEFDLYSAALLAASIGHIRDKKMMRTISAELPRQISAYEQLLIVTNENIKSSKVIAEQWSNSALGKSEQKIVDIYGLLKTNIEDYIRILKEIKKTSEDLLKKRFFFT